MRKVFSLQLLSLLFFALAASAALAGPGTPQQEIFPEIDTTTLKKRMDSAANIMLVDARSEGEYIQGHLPKAISVPPEKVRYIAGFLPKDKDIPVVFYCRGYG